MISDKMAETLAAIHDAARMGNVNCVRLLSSRIEVPEKVALRRVEKAVDKGFAEFGTSPNYAWLTAEGREAACKWFIKNDGDNQ